jgi:tRNA threonylcarbamoyladenosine biosynthesis protein TsaE
MSQQVVAYSVDDLHAIAGLLLATHPKARVFAFYGEMGAGKTTFIRTLCAHMGVTDNVTSPTFAIINEYHGRNDGAVFHFDFYRINKLQEARDVGTEGYFDSGEYCFIEWPEKVGELLPDETVAVHIARGKDDHTRVFTF